jgi:hypothetical protein
MEDLDNKFNALSSELLNDQRQKEIKEMIFECEKMNVNEFMNKLIV